MKQIIGRDGDLTETFHKDPHDPSKFHIEIAQNVSSYLKANSEDRATHRRKSSYGKGSFHKVASIPEVVVAQWWKELGSNPLAKENRKWLISKLNNRDFYKVRTRNGRI